MVPNSNSKKRLSIIVPIYNVDAYLRKCVISLEDQDIPRKEYEIICVNDGSTDNSLSVIHSMQEIYDNIVLIDQPNSGVSVARNNGIDIAKGEYVMMIDPDDFIKANVLKKRLEILTRYKPDVAYTGHSSLDKNENLEYTYDLEYDSGRVMTGIDFINTYMKGKTDIPFPHTSVGIFFNSYFLNSHKLRYLEGVHYLEDGEFMAKVSCLAEKVLFINDPFYTKTTRPGSATNSSLYHTEKARQGFLKSAHDLLCFKNNNCGNKESKNFMNQHITQYTLNYLISFNGLNYIKNYPRIYHSLKKGSLRNLDLNECSDFYRKLGKSYNISILLFYFHWHLIKTRKFLKFRLRKLLTLVFPSPWITNL